MRRWIWRIAIVLVALVAILAVALHFLMRSDLLRRMAIDAAQSHTGLTIDLHGLRTTWSGDTTIEGASIGLPLESEPFLTVGSIKVEHTGPLGMLFGGVRVQAVRVKKVVLQARQDPAGRWNLQDAAALFGQGDESSSGPCSLPHLSVTEVSIQVTTADGRAFAVSPLSLQGDPAGPGLWRFEAKVPSRFDLSGHIMTAGNWAHELDLKLEQDPAAPDAWPLLLPRAWGASAQWRGRLEDSGLSGRLTLKRAWVEQYALAGTVDLSAGQGALHLEPQGLDLKGAVQAIEKLTLAGGRVRIDAEGLRIDKLRVEAADTTARLSGQWSWSDAAGSLEAAWAGDRQGGSIHHEGTLELSMSNLLPQHPEVILNIDTRGHAPSGRWDAVVALVGTGESLDASQWRLTLKRGRWHRDEKPTVVVDGLLAVCDVSWPNVVLSEVRAGQTAQLQGRGAFDVSTKHWHAELAAKQWSPPGLDLDPFDFSLEAEGVLQKVQIKALKVASGSLSLQAEGTYEPDRQTTPIVANVSAVWDEADGAPAAPDNSVNGASEPAAPRRWAGMLRWSGTVVGEVAPLALSAAGTFEAEDVVLNRRPLHNVQMPIKAQISQQNLALQSEGFDLLEGRCSVEAEYDLAERAAAMTCEVDELPLGGVLDYVNDQLNVHGIVGGRIKISAPGLDPKKVQASGSWQVKDFAADPVAFDHMEGELRTRGSVLRLEPILLSKASGRAEGKVVFDLKDGRTVKADLNGRDWPLRMEQQQIDLVVAGHLDARVDVVDRTVDGRFELEVDAALMEKPFGSVQLQAELDQQTVKVERIAGRTLGGSFHGSADLSLAAWRQSTGQLSFYDVSPAALRTWWQQTESIEGTVSGNLTFGPSKDARAPEPFEVSLALEPADLLVRGVSVGPCQLRCFGGERRWLLHDSTIPMAGGTASLWATATRREAYYLHARLDVADLDLQQLVHAANPESDPVPGKLGGTASITAGLDSWEQATGKADLKLSESDLVNLSVIGAVYDSLHFLAKTTPTGTGNVSLRLEGTQLVVVRMGYFNRGMDVVGHGTVKDLRLGRDSPVDAFVVGAVRPLKNVNWLILRDIEKVMANLQADAAAFRVSGTVADPKPKSMPLAELVGAFQRQVLGKDKP